jgi:hypothetical protein
MSIQMVLLPVFVSVGLTFALLLWTGSGRGEARVGGETGFANQLELLFYVLIALVLPLRHADLVIVLLSWVFVVTRFVHAGIFVTSNDAGQRGPAWLAGALVLLAMWLYFALKILLLI